MKIVYLIALLLYIFILLPGCGNRREVTVSYMIDSLGLIYLPVTIAGEDFGFIFDTGSDRGMLNYRIMKQYGIYPTTKSRTNMYTYGGPFNDTIYQANREFSIGGLRFDSASFDLDHYNRSFGLESMIGEDYNGILGVKEIQTKNWLFNLKERTVTISDKAIDENRIDGSLGLCLDINPDSMVIYTNVLLNDSLKVPFLFDTGQAGYIKLDGGDVKYCWQTGITMQDSLCRLLKQTIPMKGFLRLLSEMKMNDLNLDTLSVAVAEEKMAIFYPGIPLKYPNAIGRSFLDNFDFMLYDKDNMQIRLYGYHAANQGEKDFLKARQRNLK